MSAAPLPMFLVFRKKTGCKQYPFYAVADLARWLKRKPYCNEIITVQQVTAGRFGLKTTGAASDFVCLGDSVK